MPLTLTSTSSLMAAIFVAMMDVDRKFLEVEMCKALLLVEEVKVVQSKWWLKVELKWEVKGEMSRQQQKWTDLRSIV